MAHIEIDKREFDELVGEKISEEKLREEASLLGAHWNHIEGPKWDVEVYPNRPDLLSVEGLARAYRGFFDIETGMDEYEVESGDLEVNVDESVENVRPYIGGAVIRDIELSRKKINGLIQLQEKLHETMGRRRDKIAIGLHDLNSVEPPFTYKAVGPERVSFTPLEYDKDMQLGEILDEHEKGQKYAWILENEDRYPIIEDSEGKVLSFPPIINNQLTEVEPDTADIFIDVTGKDRETVQKVLAILTTALAERGGRIESVEVGGETMPSLELEQNELDVEYFRDISGIELSAEEIAERLEKMKFGASTSSGTVKVEVPAYRNDIMHSYDLIEDVVIAHRYTNIEPELPEIDQIGSQKRIEEFTATVREVLQGTGALESHTYILSSREKLFEKMGRDTGELAEMSNALTEDYSAVRNWLLPSLVEVLQRNKHRSYPQKFFEVEDVAVLDDSSTGASNRRKIAYILSGNEVDYTDVKQVLQVLERDLGIDLEVKDAEVESFRSSRSGEVMLEDEKVGVIGELGAQVQENWELEKPVSGFELDAEKILEKIPSRRQHSIPKIKDFLQQSTLRSKLSPAGFIIRL